MAIRGYTGLNIDNTVAAINELSTLNNWGLTAAFSENRLSITDANGNVVMGLFFSSVNLNGILCYYNNGASSIGRNNYYPWDHICDIYSTSHGFLIISHAPSVNSSDVGWYAFLNINDDGKIICGTMTEVSSQPYRANHLSVCSYGDSSAQDLGFAQHSSLSATTLCNMTGAGVLGEPTVAQYTFYSPVYQTTDTGNVDIDGETYVTVGYWYLKD